MDESVRSNQVVWEQAATKYVDEYDELLQQARGGWELFPRELELLGPLLSAGPTVVHFQSGHGLDDIALVRAGARAVLGIDYSTVTAGAAQRRAADVGVPCQYVAAEVPGVPVRDG